MIFKAGDMIRVSKKNKDNYHYGLYIGQDEVVYYMETLDKKEVVKVTLENFRKRNGILELVDFPETKNGRNSLVKIEAFSDIRGLISSGTWPAWFTDTLDECVLNTIWETVAKAKSMLGKTDLKFNNGEHFVWWCKVELKRADKKAKTLDELLNPKVLMPRYPLSKKIV